MYHVVQSSGTFHALFPSPILALRLAANSGIEPRRAFGSVLAEMTARDVQNLAHIELATKFNAESASTGVWTDELPERALPACQHAIDAGPMHP
jgi:hypothetical protein